MSTVPTSNDIKYYNHLLNSFIMPNHAAIIRRAIKTYFPNINDNDLNMIYIRCKFNPRFLVKNFSLRDTFDFWYKVIMIIPKYDVLKGIEHLDIEYPKSLTHLHYLGEEGKINFEVHCKDKEKAYKSIQLTEEYIMTTLDYKSNIRVYEKALAIDELNKRINKLLEINNFLRYLGTDVMNELIGQWNTDLQLYLLVEFQ